MESGKYSFLFVLQGIVVGLAVGTAFLYWVKRIRLEFDDGENVNEDFMRSFSSQKTWKEIRIKTKKFLHAVRGEAQILFKQTLLSVLPVLVLGFTVFYFYHQSLFLLLVCKISVFGFLIVGWRCTLNFLRVLPKLITSIFRQPHSKDAIFKSALFGSLNLVLYTTALISLTAITTVWLANRAFLPLFYTNSEYEQNFSSLFIFCLFTGILILGQQTTSNLYYNSSLITSAVISNMKFELETDDSRDPAVLSKLTGKVFSEITSSSSRFYFTITTLCFSGLILFSNSPQLIIFSSSLYFPILLQTFGTMTLIATFFCAFLPFRLTKKRSITLGLKIFPVFYSFLTCGLLWSFCSLTLPVTFEFISKGRIFVIGKTVAWACVVAGELLGMVFAMVFESRSYSNKPQIVEVIESCKMGEGTGVIMGLAFGFRGCICVFIAFVGVVALAYSLGGVFGIWLLAAGSCLNLPLAYLYQFTYCFLQCGISVCDLVHFSSLVTEKIESVMKIMERGNNFAHGLKLVSNYLVALAGFRIFLYRNGVSSLNLLEPLVFCGLLIGFMLPYCFSAINLLMVLHKVKSLSTEVTRQCLEIQNFQDYLPDFLQIQQICKSSLKKHIFLTSILTSLCFLTLESYFGQHFASALYIGLLISSFLLEIYSLNCQLIWAQCHHWFTWFSDPLEASCKSTGISVHTIGQTLEHSVGDSAGTLTALLSVILLLSAN